MSHRHKANSVSSSTTNGPHVSRHSMLAEKDWSKVVPQLQTKFYQLHDAEGHAFVEALVAGSKIEEFKVEGRRLEKAQRELDKERNALDIRQQQLDWERENLEEKRRTWQSQQQGSTPALSTSNTISSNVTASPYNYHESRDIPPYSILCSSAPSSVGLQLRNFTVPPHHESNTSSSTQWQPALPQKHYNTAPSTSQVRQKDVTRLGAPIMVNSPPQSGNPIGVHSSVRNPEMQSQPHTPQARWHRGHGDSSSKRTEYQY